MFIYLARTYQDYIYSDKVLMSRIYSKTKIELPAPEMYIIYTGERSDKPEVLSLKKEFFGNSNLDIELKAKVIFADEGRKDIIGQYIAFCTVVKQQIDIYKDKNHAIQEAIRICIENGDLVEYLTYHRKEVEEFMFALFTQEEATENYGELKRLEGLEAMVKTLKKYCPDFDSVYKAVKSNDIYSDLTEEDVRRFY